MRGGVVFLLTSGYNLLDRDALGSTPPVGEGIRRASFLFLVIALISFMNYLVVKR